jgi:hypothetical protein
MDLAWTWEKIDNFGSLRERDSFVAWIREQIASGAAEEIETPADQPREPGDRWFRHLPSNSLWRLVPAENPYGPGFWPADDDDSSLDDLPPRVNDHSIEPPIPYR